MRRVSPLSVASAGTLAALVALGAVACKKDDAKAPAARADAAPAAATPPPAPAVKPPPPPQGLFEPPPAPADNAYSPEKVALGKQLFFDKRLSKDGSASCETCHLHEKSWTDGLALSTKVGGAVNTRHTPTLYNVAYLTTFYWDGRAPTLEAQIAAAWKGQMGADPAAIATALAAVPGYAESFKKVFGEAPTGDNIPKALAAYLRTLLAGASAWDRYEAGDRAAVSEDAVAGYKLFTQKGQCVLCHMPPVYTDSLFHNIGLEAGKAEPDLGRGKITSNPRENGAFKTPTLRGVAKSAPYFHDGSAKTLEEAVRYMASGGKPDPNLDARLRPTGLTDAEIKQLVAFLEALSPSDTLEKPTLP
jgi:cytochrome c peroxidase